MSPCNEMICQHVTLSGYAERPKVADAVIEALKPFICWLSCCHNTSLCGLGRSRMSTHQRIDHTRIVDARVVRDPYRNDPWEERFTSLADVGHAREATK